MKTQIFFRPLAAMFALFATACTINSDLDLYGENKYDTSFSGAEMFYFFDDFVPEVGSFGIALFDGDPDGDYTELYLDFASEYFEDALQAVPDEGTYRFSDSFAENTFNSDYSSYIDRSKGLNLGVVDGLFVLSRSAAGYKLNYDVKLENGSILKGVYEGKISGMHEPTIATNVKLDFDAMETSGAQAFKMDDNMWYVVLWGEPESGSMKGGEVEIALMINSPAGTLLPEGKFPMANKAWQGVEYTAEPASSYDMGVIDGSYFQHSEGDISWAVPGEGLVEIRQTDEGRQISFSFEDPNGYIVSGSYTGDINGIPNTRAAGQQTFGLQTSSEAGQRHQ